MNGDVFKPEDFVPVIDPPEGLSQKNTEKSFVLYRSETTMRRNIEVELGDFQGKSDWVVYFSRRLSLVLQVLVTHGFVNFSNTGVVSVLEKPDLQSSEPVAPQLGFVNKKRLASPGKKLGATRYFRTNQFLPRPKKPGGAKRRGLGYDGVLGYCSDEVFVKSRVPGEFRMEGGPDDVLLLNCDYSVF